MAHHIDEYAQVHQDEVVECARKCALATIQYVYNDNRDCEGLSDVDIDKVRDAMQVLMYIKSLK